MKSKREEAFVGAFVLVAAAILVFTMLSLSGFLQRGGTPFRAYFKNAGGLGPGAQVRYAGGPTIGRVTQVRSDPQNPARMEIQFRVNADVPVKTDSTVKIASLSALGDNFLAILPGTPAAAVAPAHSVLQSADYVALDELVGKLSAIAPAAEKLLKDLDSRAGELRETIADVNDLLNAQNRGNITASLANARGMLEENRPAVHATLGHLNEASAKAGPLLDDFKKTAKQANDALAHLDATLVENRTDLRQSIAKLREALASVASLTERLDRTMNVNTENMDETLDNIRRTTENLKEFTETIKTRPSTLIRSSSPKPRQPGDKPKP